MGKAVYLLYNGISHVSRLLSVHLNPNCLLLTDSIKIIASVVTPLYYPSILVSSTMPVQRLLGW